jgi:hypothetical protein
MTPMDDHEAKKIHRRLDRDPPGDGDRPGGTSEKPSGVKTPGALAWRLALFHAAAFGSLLFGISSCYDGRTMADSARIALVGIVGLMAPWWINYRLGNGNQGVGFSGGMIAVSTRLSPTLPADDVLLKMTITSLFLIGFVVIAYTVRSMTRKRPIAASRPFQVHGPK